MSEPADETVAPPPAPEPARQSTPQPAPGARRVNVALLVAIAAAVILVGAVAAAPFWAPPVMLALPWGGGKEVARAVKPMSQASPAPDPAIAAAKAQAMQNAAALQQLMQRVAALEAKPPPAPPDLGPIRQQLDALGRTTADLDKKIAVLTAQVQQQPATDPRSVALALAVLQIREAVDIGRPFAAEYRALADLTRDRPAIAAAAAPLADLAASGVASRAALAARLHQLAPQIATAEPPPQPGWRARIVARLRALVTVRRIDGAGQSPSEAAVGTAQHAMAGGDLAGAVDALAKLGGAHAAAAEPWLRMARQRLAAESALHAVGVALTAALGHSGADQE